MNRCKKTAKLYRIRQAEAQSYVRLRPLNEKATTSQIRRYFERALSAADELIQEIMKVTRRRGKVLRHEAAKRGC